MTIKIDKTQLNYTIKGTGKPLIMLHGWGGSISSLEELGNILSSKFQVVNLDLPGFGESSSPIGAWGSLDYANVIRKLCKELNIEKPVILGHSNGGKIALSYSLNYPDEISSLILVASSGIRAPLSFKKKLIQKLASVFKPLSNVRFLRKLLYKFIGERDYINSGKLKPTFLKLISEDLSDTISNVHAETLIIWGELDKQTPLWMGQIMNEKITNSTTQVVEGASHNLPLVKPTKVASIIFKVLLDDRFS